MLHISDTIQQHSGDISQHDTTVDRIKIWYESISQYLGIPAGQEINFKSSPFGKSYVTGAQALSYLKQNEFNEPQVILVNNASRAKYINSGEAKGSSCLWAQLDINGITHHVVGVDNDTFDVFGSDLKQGTQIKKITSLKPTNQFRFPEIPDFSKGTQFRSKEYFPLIQLIFEAIKKRDGKIDINRLEKNFIISDIEYNFSKDINRSSRGIQDILDSTLKQKAYRKKYLPGFKGIEQIQLFGEQHRLEELLGIGQISHKVSLIRNYPNLIAQYNSIRNTLKTYEICLIDRDKFGNAKFIYSSQIDGDTLEDFYEEANLHIGESTYLLNQDGKLISQLLVSKTISDSTGKPCIWGGSSRGVDGEVLLEVNKSIGPDGGVLEELQELPIGTVLNIGPSQEVSDSLDISGTDRPFESGHYFYQS